MEYFTKDRNCSQCGIRFKEIDQICKFKCGSHPGNYVNGKWTCCQNKKRYRSYCVKFDHHDEETELKTFPELKVNVRENSDMKVVICKIIEPIIRKKNNHVRTEGFTLICKRK